MSLTKCPECGGQVSDRSSVCVHCGYPLGAPTVEDVARDISSPHERALIKAKHDALTPDDPVAAAQGAHAERLEHAHRFYTQGNYTADQYAGFLRASEAELERDLDDAKRTHPTIGLRLQRIGAVALILFGALYVAYVIAIEWRASTVPYFGGVDLPRFLVAAPASLAMSAAWMLPIGVWWLWRTYR